MGLHVVPQIPLPVERLAADFAAVSGGCGRRGLLLAAPLALRRLWARAPALLVAVAVSLQRTPLQEPLPTLAGVGLLVAPQRAGSGEALPTDAAVVRFDPRVASHVHFHVLEGSSTDPAGSARVSVGLQVRQQSFG